MTLFSVWAPEAAAVELDTDGRRRPMIRVAGGYHELEVPDAGPGDDYRFVLDGGSPRPDPRSAHQPRGIDGSSRVVDHGAYRWTDRQWRPPRLQDAVFYELHVGTFTPEGTFDAVVERLDHLVRLGVDAIELMPVAEFSGHRGWGYDGVDLYAPHHAYGGPDGLRRLVDACHAKGLAVVMDVVYNHLGPAGNYLSEFGPYFTDRYSTPWGEAVNFDGPGSDEVRRFFIDNALMWLDDYHCDGLRLDAVHAILDTSAVHFLEELTGEVRRLEAGTGRSFWVIAESGLNDPRVVRPVEAGGYGVDAQWSDDFHHAMHASLTGERDGYYEDFGPLADVAAALRRAFVYDGRYSRYRRRRFGAPATGLAGTRFLGYLQNHDQVGNRALGERAGALMPPGLVKIAGALVLTSPFVPLLFMGEEWDASSPFLYFTDHRDPELGRAVSEGRRREFAAFGWDPASVPDPQDPATFSRSKLDWSELEDPRHADMLEWYRDLIRLRREVPALTDDRMDEVRTRYDEEGRWIVVQRGPVTVACNLSSAPAELPVESNRRSRLLQASGKHRAASGDRIELEGTTVAVWHA